MRADLPTGTVTFCFTDVEGSTRLLHALGAEAYAEALAEHRRLIREACTAQGGVEVDTQGDAFFFAFASAEGALRAASAFTDALAFGPIQVRCGLHTGSPLLAEEGYVGDDVHLAARVAATSHGGQVVLSSATASLLEAGGAEPRALPLRALGSHRLKDVAEPVEIFQLGEGSFPPLRTIANSNLPTPASSFLGREAELLEADALLRSTRLLTITGPGGQGKTRFSLELATRAREERFSDYPHGVFACFLSSLRDPSLVLPTIAHTLSLSEQPGSSALEVIAGHLEGRRLLLLLDNLEHLLAAAPALAQLLERCAGLTLLVTSREVLRIQGETSYALPPLAEDTSLALVCERARVEPSSALSALATRLEGLPLALELAAARLAVLTPAQLLERLAQRLDLLKAGRDADPRQQTLRATIEWSYDLLGEQEQRLFRSLSVFAGGCTLEAAEEVCSADLDGLQSLVDKSLLRFTDGRFWMLETIREFAGEQLTEAEEEAVSRNHARWFENWVRGLLGEPGVSRPTGDLKDVAGDHENCRHALAWGWIADRDVALRLGASLVAFWLFRSHFRDAIAWREEARRNIAEAPKEVRLRALKMSGVIAYYVLAEPDVARRDWDLALELARSLGARRDELYLRSRLAMVSVERGDLETAIAIFEENLEAYRGLGDRYSEIQSLHDLGQTRRVAGDLAGAEDALTAVVSAHREGGWNSALLHSLHSLGDLALLRHDYGRACALYRESLELSLSEGDERSSVYCLAGIAGVLQGRGESDAAARLWGAVVAAEQTLGFRMLPFERRKYEIALQAHEGSPAWNEGRSLDVQGAVKFARQSLD